MAAPLSSDHSDLGTEPTARRSGFAGRLVRRLGAAYDRHAGAAGTAGAVGDQAPPAFEVVLPDGERHRFGRGEARFALLVRDRRGLAALASLDETRVALAYVEGSLDFDGPLLEVLALRGLVSDRHPLRELWSKVLHARLFGQTRSDEKWIAQHYDLGEGFYLAFLDRRRCYSHGVFAADDEPLDDAILRKLDYALEAVGAKPGQRILDIGAGWGAMTEHAGRRGIECTSLTISEPSEQYVARLIDEAGLPCRVLRRHFLEYRLEPGEAPYDAIVNLGVTEHLPDYPATLEQYRRLLAPGGRVYLDACSTPKKFPFSSFTYRFIFPGNATPLCLHDYLAAVAATPFELIGVENDRRSYELTCRRWAENLEAARDELEARWGEPAFRRFQLYLWGCVDCFARNVFGAYRVVLELPR